jgi:glycosyltransferase involved in cell wall biosynthesis
MSKYPGVILFRHSIYSHIDTFINDNKNKYMCTFFNINDDITELNRLFNENYHILITVSNNSATESYEYDYLSKHIPNRFLSKWIHKSIDDFKDIDVFNENINYNYIHNVIRNREYTRPVFSLFTTCYNSYDFIKTAYNSIKSQTLIDWEWVILDDSPEDKHFDYLKDLFHNDYKVRLYKRSGNSGNIGNVKNEVISLCRGKYILEMDHDDIIFDTCLQDACDIFEADDKIGFIYGDTVPMDRQFNPYTYGDFIGKGYGSDYLQYKDDKWIYVYLTPSINNITLSHLVCCPNHPRIWRRDAMYDMQNYSEYLPICDDYEIILRSCCNYDVAKINKPLYIQFANDNGNNFSSIRNSEINRIGPKYIYPIYYNDYKVHDKMKEKNAYEDPKYITEYSQIWKRDSSYEHKRMNHIYNYDYTHQYCIINDAIFDYNKIITLSDNSMNDFIFLTNIYTEKKALEILDHYNLRHIKCKSLMNSSDNELIKFFKMLIKNDNCQDTILINQIIDPLYNSELKFNYHVINDIIKTNNYNSYLEIGVESGETFNNIICNSKIGIDPDISINITESLLKCSSNDFFINNSNMFDIILIDGMHQIEYLHHDFKNCLNYLNHNGSIVITNIFPENYREQCKVPIKHYYNNEILKYSEPWTGDIWKYVYHVIKHYKFTYKIYNNKSNRGFIQFFNINKEEELYTDILSIDIREINNYDYNKDYSDFINILK